MAHPWGARIPHTRGGEPEAGESSSWAELNSGQDAPC